MEIIIGEKFTSKDLDKVVADYWEKTINSKTGETINFDLTNLTWIALEELNFLFGWLRFLMVNDKNVFVKLPDLNPNDERKFRRVISLWYRWKIFTLTPFNQEMGRYDYEKYFNVTTQINKVIEQEITKDKVRQQFGDNNWHKIIPFHFINADYKDDFRILRETLNKELDGIFKIEKQIEDLLNSETCYSPFQNKTLSHVVTTELYLNVIHHSFDENCEDPKECYLSVALSNARNAEKNFEYQTKHGIKTTLKEVEGKIQKQLKTNLENEKCLEEREFYLTSKGQCRNESFVEFSFLDFGKGVANTLKEKFNNDIQKIEIQTKLTSFQQKKNYDTQVLEYAFLLQTSRNELKENIRLQSYIPRGLFFLVDIVKRYNGMLIARSAKGKIVFDFRDFNFNAEKKTSNKDFIKFSKDDSTLPFFQGTLYTIIIPATKEILLNAIQDDSKLLATKKSLFPYKYIDINQVFQEVLKSHPGELTLHDTYDYIFVALTKALEKHSNERCILILDFQHIDNSVIDTKLYYFLCHHPLVNEMCNAIIVNPPDKGLLKDIQKSLSIQDLHLLRPIPCVISPNEVVWLGLKNIADETLLNKYWHYEQKPNYSASDFENFKWKDFEKLRGNIVQFDKFGNMEFTIPDFNNFWHFLKIDKPRIELADLLNTPTEEILLGE
jgi:hypothetical protein